jgi:crossover junction endodeoxyribonuclease RuvC
VNYLLTLDLATRVGWTCGKPEDTRFSSGTHTLPSTGEDIGAFLEAAEQWLEGTLNGVAQCVFESPILPRLTSIATCRKLYGLAGLAELACHRRHIRCMELSNATVKAFMGVRKAPGCRDLKAQMIDAVALHGYQATTHDEADAIAIRLYILHKFHPEHRRAFSLDLGRLGAAADNG